MLSLFGMGSSDRCTYDGFSLRPGMDGWRGALASWRTPPKNIPKRCSPGASCAASAEAIRRGPNEGFARSILSARGIVAFFAKVTSRPSRLGETSLGGLPKRSLSTASEPQALHRPCRSRSIAATQLTHHHFFSTGSSPVEGGASRVAQLSWVGKTFSTSCVVSATRFHRTANSVHSWKVYDMCMCLQSASRDAGFAVNDHA